MSPMTLFVERPPEVNEVVAGSPSAFVSFPSVRIAIPERGGRLFKASPLPSGHFDTQLLSGAK